MNLTRSRKSPWKPRHLASAVLFAAVLLSPFILVQACGPDFEPDVFVRLNMPDDLPAFNQGHLGILQSGYDSDQYAVAYRYLNGGYLAAAELTADQPLGSEWKRNEPDRQSNPQQNSESATPADYSAARSKYTSDTPRPGHPTPSAKDNSGDTVLDPDYNNCPVAAVQTALITLGKRAASWGAKSPLLLDWIHAQDAVFTNCTGSNVAIPAPAPANSPALLRADRAYQVAAANFYARNYDQAAQQFAAIALDKSSPWSGWGGYLAARAIVRKAFAATKATEAYSGNLATFDLPTMQTAQRMLETLLAQRDPQPSRKILQAELNFIRIRTEPQKRLTEISAALAGPAPDPNFAQDRADLSFALMKQIPVVDPPPLLVWIAAFRNTNKPGAELTLWQNTHALPWLVAALVHAEPRDAATPELLAAAEKIQPNSPAFRTVSFHRIRLLIGLRQQDRARDLLDQALAGKQTDELGIEPGSDRNALLGERMSLARNFPELLTYAPREDLQSHTSGSETLFAACERRPQAQTDPSFCTRTQVLLEFDEDSASLLNLQTPLSLLVEAATSPTLPANLREEVTLAAWTRSVLLEDPASAQKLFPLLPKPLRNSILTDGTGYSAVLAILRNPGLRPFVEAGVSRLASYNELDSFRDNWWGDGWDKPGDGNPGSEPQAGALPVPERLQSIPGLTQPQKQAARAESDRLAKFPLAPALLGHRVLEYAKDHPDDPTVPEALHLTVRATRYGQGRSDGSKDPEISAVSKSAFQFLHSHYPKSAWTAKTPYYY